MAIVEDHAAIAGRMAGRNHLPLVTRSEHHELAIWHAASDAGAWPYAPGHECHEPHIWAVYTELEGAGLLRRAGLEEVGYHRRRMKFVATEAGVEARRQMERLDAQVQEMEAAQAAALSAYRESLIVRGLGR